MKFNLVDAPREVLLGILTFLVQRTDGKRIDLLLSETTENSKDLKENSLYFIYEVKDSGDATLYLEEVPDPYRN